MVEKLDNGRWQREGDHSGRWRCKTGEERQQRETSENDDGASGGDGTGYVARYVGAVGKEGCERLQWEIELLYKGDDRRYSKVRDIGKKQCLETTMRDYRGRE